MVFILLQIVLVLLAGVVFSTLASEAFAYEVSRIVEGCFEFIEYRLALRDERRAGMNVEAGFVRESLRETQAVPQFTTSGFSL